MFTNYLELILGLVVIFALLSVLVSLLNELYRNLIRDRGKMMYEYVHKMLIDEQNLDLTYLTFRHPLIDNARKDNSHCPSYIEPKIFAAAFIQTVGDLSTEVSYKHNNDGVYTKNEVRDTDPIVRFTKSTQKLNDGPLKSTLLAMAERAELDSTNKYANLENQLIDWFNFQMKALTMEYKNKQRKSLLCFGFAITLFLNVDSIHLVHELRNDPVLRKELNAKAESINMEYAALVEELKNSENDELIEDNLALADKINNISAQIKVTNEKIDALELPIGYSRNSAPLSWFIGKKEFEPGYDTKRNSPRPIGVVFYIIGILISGFSLSMGAPFWFDILNKAVNLKQGGK
jgi:hypothetical protein